MKFSVRDVSHTFKCMCCKCPNAAVTVYLSVVAY